MWKVKNWVFSGLALASMACVPTSSPADVQTRDIGQRRYILLDPKEVSGPAPLVLALHGGFGSAEGLSKSLPLEGQAAQMGFRVAYLEGIGAGPRRDRARTWNAGDCCGPAQKRGVNDLRYMKGVIRQLQREGLVSSVNLVGHSNGGMMVYRFLCESQFPVASAVIISGSKMVPGCDLPARTRVLLIHGSKDRNVPLSGGRGQGPSRAVYTSFRNSADQLKRGGALLEEELLSEAGHRLGEINAVLRGKLPQRVATFMFGG
ncbi:alpha/beta hydrolase family esterase [Tritonibacter multivorans]|nr:alpha/beta hydrolase [Tritonibacter multivorans]MDA7422054.1 alpha/beta hydrolase [Tritonibacter multivorans]